MRLIGCYEFGREPWRLVEVAFYDLEEPLVLTDFTASSGERVPVHDLHLLDGSGTRALHGGVAAAPGAAPQLVGDVRLCFFVELPGDAPLQTPFGELCLGALTPKPPRLRFVEFYPP